MPDFGDTTLPESPGSLPNGRRVAGEGEIVVRCRGVRMSYDGRAILHGVDLEVRKGETLVIMGGSGQG